MRNKLLLSAGLMTSLCTMTVFAEPPVQPGDTLESLSQVKVMTTVNGQQGSLDDLVNSGKVQVMSNQTPPPAAPVNPAPPQDMQATAPTQADLPEQQPAAAPNQGAIDPNVPAQAMPTPMDSSSDQPMPMPAQ